MQNKKFVYKIIIYENENVGIFGEIHILYQRQTEEKKSNFVKKKGYAQKY